MPELELEVAPFGPDDKEIEQGAAQALLSPVVQEQLRNTRHVMISIGLVEPPGKTAEPVPPNGYRMTVYDYTHERTLIVQWPLDKPEAAHVIPSDEQPLPS